MEIQSVPPGPASLFSMAAFGRPDQQLQQQLQQRNQQTQQFLMQNYGYDSSAFFNQSQQFFQNFYNLSGMRQAEIMIETGKIETVDAKESTFFTPIVHVEQFQTATFYQQNYLMANPYVRQMFLDGNLSGYAESYTNHFGNVTMFEDPVFRQAVDGLSQSSYQELDPEMDEVYVECLDDDIQGLERLTAIGQSNMVQAWRMQNVLVDEGIDPTDKDLGHIGE